MDTSYQQLNDSLSQQNQKTFTLSNPIVPSTIPKESIQQQESLEGWKMTSQQRVSSYSEGWKTSQQQGFKKPKPLPNVPLQHRHSMPPGDFYQNNLYYDQYQQQYHYSYQSPPAMYSADCYYESTPNLVNEPYYTNATYDSQQQQIYPYQQQQQQQQYQTEDYFNYTSPLPPSSSSTQHIPYYNNNSNNNLVYDEPPTLLPTPPSLIPSSSTTTTTTSPTTPIPTTNDNPILSLKSSSSTTTTTTTTTTTNDNNKNQDKVKDKNQNNNTPKNKISIPTKSSFSPLDNRSNIKQITVKSVNKEYRVWIEILPTETGLSLADKIHHIATFRTKKITKIITNQGRVIPLDARPIFGNWMDMSTFKNGDFWEVEWCELDKSPMDKFFSKWLQVGSNSKRPASTKKSKPS